MMGTAMQPARVLSPREGDRSRFDGRLPGLAEVRAEGRQRFAATGFPSRRQEAWKYTDLSPLRHMALRAPTSADDAIKAALPAPLASGDPPVLRMVFVNGRFRPELSALDDPIPGLTIATLAEVPDPVRGMVERRLGRIAAMDDAPMAALNVAEFRDGCVVELSPGRVLERPIELVFIGGTALDPLIYHPRHLIILGEGAAATLIEQHHGQGNVPYLANTVSEVSLGAGARLRHLKVQAEGEEAWHVATTAVCVAASAAYEAFGLALGARLSRLETSVFLQGAHARCTVGGAYLIRGRQHCDNTLRIEHRAPSTSCAEVFRGVVAGAARAVFQGTIVVQPGAQGTDAHQESKALLLSDDAEVDQKPALEIYADDVKCSHGAAVGQLDGEALFYLRSRGLDDALARHLLIEGFLTEAFAQITDEPSRASLLARALHWFGSHSTRVRT